MNRFLTIAGSALAGFGLALTMAQTVDAAEYRNPHLDIVRAVAKAGYSVDTEHQACDDNPNLYGFVRSSAKEFVICFDNAGSMTQIWRTTRHEAIHVAQICKGGLLSPFRKEAITQRAIDSGFVPDSYPARQLHIEAEARVYADIMSAQEVTSLVNIQCQ